LLRTVTWQGHFNASSAAIAAHNSIRLFVVSLRPPVIFLTPLT
jgi:hypothetical protein